MTGKKQQESQRSNLERHEYAALAAGLIKDRPEYALLAMGEFYKNCGLEDDPIIAYALNDATVGIRAGQGISNSGVIAAIGTYERAFNKAYENSRVGEFISYIGSRGFSKIPEGLNELIKKYEKLTVKEISEKAKKDKDDKDIANIYKTLNALLHQLFEGQLYSTV